MSSIRSGDGHRLGRVHLLDRIDPAGLDLADDAMTLADALVYDTPGEAGEAHWSEEAKELIAGLIQHVGRPLLTPDEVRVVPGELELLFLAGQRPIISAKLAYYADREFAGRFDPA
ncbi:type IV secretory system conjugative DNA transfer family protein [Sphingobium sp. LB126]|uniref:type IV secretory system conjugative DNA transfer family protein n=1 Tax=Sphingobium sp. LB126 TaxID=1983755 RepID=UPI0018D580FF|nr:type IV secretory system conjugative DNA transfer family protein [Sphingobium sp. LB126]